MAIQIEQPAPASTRRLYRRRIARVGLTRTERGRQRELRAGIGILAVIVVASVVVPYASPYGVNSFVTLPLQHPTWAHPFGTDEVGRDILTRTFAAGRLNLAIAAAGVAVPLLLGSIIGVAAGAARSRLVDGIVMRIVDGIIAIPFVVLVLALVVVIGTQRKLWILPAGIPALMAAIYSTSWAIYTRLARGQTLALRTREYVLAARLLGYSRWRVTSRHLFPSVFATTATYAASEAILIVSVTASLAFLGAGVSPPTPEWGSLIYEGRDLLPTAWWLSVMPGLVLAITGFSLMLIADAIIDRTDS